MMNFEMEVDLILSLLNKISSKQQSFIKIHNFSFKNTAYQYKKAGSEPRRNSCNWTLLMVSNIRIRVPFTLAVAINVPFWLIARQARSDVWAFIITGALDEPASVLHKSCKGNYHNWKTKIQPSFSNWWM